MQEIAVTSETAMKIPTNSSLETLDQRVFDGHPTLPEDDTSREHASYEEKHVGIKGLFVELHDAKWELRFHSAANKSLLEKPGI
jgi:hypothetical protein